MKEITTRFETFEKWEYQKLNSLLFEVKERILQKDECLCREGMALNYVYFLMNGRLRVEKEVDVYDKNYWPTDKHAWCEKKIDSHVLFKIQEIKPYTILGERECIDELI